MNLTVEFKIDLRIGRVIAVSSTEAKDKQNIYMVGSIDESFNENTAHPYIIAGISFYSSTKTFQLKRHDSKMAAVAQQKLLLRTCKAHSSSFTMVVSQRRRPKDPS